MGKRMTRRSLKSQTGEQITWLEAVIRTTKGLGRPARVNEIGDYMLEHIITEYPKKAKTPLQTISMLLYTHSKDSVAGRQSEHIFYTTDKGFWGLCNPDKWRNHRSDKTCDPIVMRALTNLRLIYSEEAAEECSRLREKAEEWELLFGEIMLLDAVQVKDHATKHYFEHAWHCAIHLKPLLNLYIWEITDEQAAETLRDCIPDHRKNAMRWVYGARKSEYNTKKPEENHGIHTGPVIAFRENKARKFIREISFPEDYVLPMHAQLITVFKYWIWQEKEERPENYFCTQYTVFKKLKPLHEKQYRLIRPDHVRTCMNGLSQIQKNNIIVLYHLLDNLAYEMDLIPRMYARTIHTVRVNSNRVNEFTQEEIDRLKEHAGELDVDMTLVLLYTGLTAQEVCVLTLDDVDRQYIHIPNERTVFYGRDIPLHPIIAQPLKHVLRFLESQDATHVSSRRRCFGIQQMVGNSTLEYCGNRHTPVQCRSSFASRAEEAGASGGIIISLLGTATVRNSFTAAQMAYTHPSRDKIYNAVMNMR